MLTAHGHGQRVTLRLLAGHLPGVGALWGAHRRADELRRDPGLNLARPLDGGEMRAP